MFNEDEIGVVALIRANNGVTCHVNSMNCNKHLL